MMDTQASAFFPRTVLLMEIDRRCSFAECNARMLIGLTREEALNYRGFECDRCGQWNDDRLKERDVPDWWPEIQARNAF
jgi:hypothetical protein